MVLVDLAEFEFRVSFTFLGIRVWFCSVYDREILEGCFPYKAILGSTSSS